MQAPLPPLSSCNIPARARLPMLQPTPRPAKSPRTLIFAPPRCGGTLHRFETNRHRVEDSIHHGVACRFQWSQSQSNDPRTVDASSSHDHWLSLIARAVRKDPARFHSCELVETCLPFCLVESSFVSQGHCFAARSTWSLQLATCDTRTIKATLS